MLNICDELYQLQIKIENLSKTMEDNELQENIKQLEEMIAHADNLNKRLNNEIY